MEQTKKKPAKILISCGLALALACALPMAALADDADDTEATVTFTEGVLEIASVPNLTFTETELGPDAYEVELASADANVAVSDMRGTYGSWTLTMALAAFECADPASADSLPAASITVAGATPTGPTGITPATCEGAIEAVSDGTPTAVTVLEAEEDAGYGIWSADWAAATTKLVIPNTVALTTGTHVANMHWDLVDGL